MTRKSQLEIGFKNQDFHASNAVGFSGFSRHPTSRRAQLASMSFKPADKIAKLSYSGRGLRMIMSLERTGNDQDPLQVLVIGTIVRQRVEVVGRDPLLHWEQSCRRSAVGSLLLGTAFAQSVAWICPNHVHHLSKPLLFVWCQHNRTVLIPSASHQLVAARRESCHTHHLGAITDWMFSTSGGGKRCVPNLLSHDSACVLYPLSRPALSALACVLKKENHYAAA